MNSVPTENPLVMNPLPRLFKNLLQSKHYRNACQFLYNIVDQVFIDQRSAISVMQLLMLRFL